VETVVLAADESLCDKIKSKDGSTACPAAGNYTITDRFYWGGQSDQYKYSFTPKVSLGVASVQNNNQYDLGGANTNKCSGGTFSTWTSGVAKSAAESVASFFVTFGVLVGSILAILIAAWGIMRSSRRKREPAIIVDEDLDEMSYKAIRDNNNNSVVDVV
jgi:hypothetical protein